MAPEQSARFRTLFGQFRNSLKNECNESPLLGEKPDFWPVSKFNTRSLPLRGILPVKQQKSLF